MRHILLQVLLLLLFVTGNVPGFAQLAAPENIIIDVTTEGDAVWLSTQAGLIGFDKTAETWETFLPQDETSDLFIIMATTARPAGGLYVATASRGIWLFDNENWEQVTGFEEVSFRGVYYDWEETLWVLGSVYIYEKTDNDWNIYNRGNLDSSYPNNSLGFQTNGTVWISGYWGISNIIDGEIEQLIYDTKIYNKLVVDANDWVWIARADTLLKTDGAEWHRFDPTNTNFEGSGIYALCLDNNNNLWAGGSHWIGSFNGTMWTVYDSTDCSFLSETDVYDLQFDSEETLWIGTRHGLLKFDGTTWTHYDLETGEITTAVEEPSNTPSAIDLLPAYPNPFNPETTISYVLPEAGKVTLTVHSVTGQQVAVLVDGYMDAGSHSVVFDGEGLASGMYFCRLSIDGRTITQKLTLVR